MFKLFARPLRQVRLYSTEPPMMAEVRNSLKTAMRSGDNVSKTTIRAVMAAVKNANIDKPDSISTDLGLHGLLSSLISKREKSIEEYKKGNREDLAEGERAEIKVLQELQAKIPVASDEEIDAKVNEYIDSLGLQGKIPMGKVLSQLNWPEVEANWKASQKSVVASVKRVLGTRSFSTSARQLSHDNPLGIPRRRPNQSVITKQRIPKVKNVILVSSAKGGVGKSTVAVNLALALYMQGFRSGVLDVDIFGPSIPTLLKIDGEPKITSEGNLVPLVNYGIKAMSMGFLVPPDRAVSWRGLLVQKALQQLLFEVDWDELDYLVIDMPPGTGDVQLTIAQQLIVDGAIVVSTPQDIALIDAIRGIDMFNTVKTPILGLVQNMSVFICPHCQNGTHIFGHDGAVKVAQDRGINVLASLPLTAEIAQGGDGGLPVVFQDPETCASAKAYLELSSRVCERLHDMRAAA